RLGSAQSRRGARRNRPEIQSPRRQGAAARLWAGPTGGLDDATAGGNRRRSEDEQELRELHCPGGSSGGDVRQTHVHQRYTHAQVLRTPDHTRPGSGKDDAPNGGEAGTLGADRRAVPWGKGGAPGEGEFSAEIPRARLPRTTGCLRDTDSKTCHKPSRSSNRIGGPGGPDWASAE